MQNVKMIALCSLLVKHGTKILLHVRAQRSYTYAWHLFLQYTRILQWYLTNDVKATYSHQFFIRTEKNQLTHLRRRIDSRETISYDGFESETGFAKLGFRLR